MMTYIFYLFLAFLLYNIVFKIVIPIYRTTRQVKQGFREMNARMQGQTPNENGFSTESRKKTAPAKKEAEYIDFEEIKE
jgi:hypothetical protein